MSVQKDNPFGAEWALVSQAGTVRFYSLAKLANRGIGKIDRLPFSIRVLLENLLRNVDGFQVTVEDVNRLAAWSPKPAEIELPFKPGRGGPSGLHGRAGLGGSGRPCGRPLRRLGGDPRRINPQVPCDLIIDHSVQVDTFGTPDALRINQEIEFERNRSGTRSSSGASKPSTTSASCRQRPESSTKSTSST